MKKILSISLLMIFLINAVVFAQKKQPSTNPFQRVKIPENVYLQLEKKYKEVTGYDSVNAGKNVWNLLDRKNITLVNSIYSFAGQGPHFPRLIFVYHNDKIIVINAIGAYAPLKVINEYAKCAKELSLSDGEIRKYLKAISLYLTQEEGQTYGSEIKKTH